MSLMIVFAWTANPLLAQDSTKQGVKKQLSSENEKADNLNGKKIQQQSLLNNHFEKLGADSAKPATKKKPKSKHKHS